MRRLAIGILACAIAGTTALATGVAITDDVRNTLTQIDTVPTKTQIDTAFGSGADPVTNLSAIAQDLDSDAGVRVRAIHGLGKYCASPCPSDDVVHEALVALINANKDESIGQPLVLLRAAVETLGALDIPADSSQPDVDLLVGLLDHTSRDIRASSARALRDLCNTTAVVPLRTRYTVESTEQVKLAISDALRVLEQCGQ